MAAFPTQPLATPSEPGRGRRVLLLISGGIAAYKSCEVLRRLDDAGCRVRVAMTEAATRFVGPLTFEALSGQPVGTSLWGEGGEAPLDHIQWAREADLVLVAPATADFLAKMSLGRADDLPSTLVTAAARPVLVAPSMNDRMWRNPPTQEHVHRLRARGVRVLEPGTGHLACGTVAEGRLAQPDAIVAEVLRLLTPGPLAGTRVVVTAGGTREPIDAVRYLGNRSSGRMGMALADAAASLGAEVTLLLGPTELSPPAGVDVTTFTTTDDLATALSGVAPRADAIAMAAAVADFRPRRAKAVKHKKADGPPRLDLEPTDDLLARLGASKPPGQCLIGFALETGDDATVEAEAQRKLGAKGCDLVCGNRADRPGEGFEGESNRLYVARRDGAGGWLGPACKRSLAEAVWREALSLFAAAPPPAAQGEEAT